MNRSLRKALFQVHLWTGIAFGLYVVVVSLSGSAVVFREEMNNSLNAHLFRAESAAKERPIADVEKVVREISAAYPGHQVGGVYPPGPERQTFRVYVSKQGALTQVFAHPNTGKLLGELDDDDSIVRWLQELHFELLAGRTGEIVNAIGAAALVIMCLTGLVIWWPSMTVLVDFRKGWKRINWELHSTVGFWTLALLLMWAVTGVYFIFPTEFRAAVNSVSPLSSAGATVSSNRDALGEDKPLPAIRGFIEKAQQEMPGSWVDRLNLPANERAPLTVVMERNAPRTLRKPGSDYVYFYFDRFSGELLQKWENPQPTAGDTVMSWIVLLHLGTFGGVAIKILWVLLGLLPPLLFITGALMWWNRVATVGALYERPFSWSQRNTGGHRPALQKKNKNKNPEKEMMKSRIAFLIAVSLACSPVIYGQTPATETTDTSDPFHPKTNVVVTATRSELEVDKTPVSASVVTREEIEARPMKTIDQLLSLTEGVYHGRSQGNSSSGGGVSVRGFNSSARTLVLLDGHPINDAYASSVNWSSVPIGEVESIEVARGPFSSLYGGNALGGVINIVTRPVERRQFEATTQYGSYDTINYSGRYSDLFYNRLGLTASYERFQTAGYHSRRITTTPTAATTGPLVTGALPTTSNQGAPVLIVGESGRSGLNRQAYRFKGDYTFNASTFTSLQYARHDMEWGYTGGQSYLRDAGGNPASLGAYLFNNNGNLQRITLTSSSFVPEGPGNQSSNFYTATLRHDFAGGRLFRIDGSLYHIPSFAFRQPGTGANEVGGPGSITDGSRHSYHLNAQYQFTARNNNLIMGAETRHDKAANGNFVLPNWMVKDQRANQTLAASGKSVNQSVYVQDSIAATDRLNVVIGVRYDYSKGYDGQSNSFNATAPLTLYPNRTDNRLTGKVAVAYSLPSDWNIRLSAGTAFREPNVFDLYATSVSASGIISKSNPELKPEKLNSWEAGVRKRFGENTNFDVAYYENYITDLIYRFTDLAADASGRIRVNVNAGKGRTRGLEAGMRQNILPGLQFRATYTMTHAVITENPAVPTTEGKRVTQIPRNLFSGQLLGIYGKWTGSLAGRYVGKHYSSDINADTTKGVPGGYDPYFLADANLGYNVTPQVQVFVSGENLLNRTYYQFYLAPGRQVYGGLRIKL